MRDQKLYVVTCISNPVRYESRYRLYQDFKKRVEEAGAILYTAEMAFGDRDFVVTERDNPRHVQVRSHFELWHKENLLNLAIQALPDDWKYVAWIDADVQFCRPDWVNETIEQLQHYRFVQMFSHAQDLSPTHEPMKTHTGFIHDWYQNPDSVKKGGYATFSHPGFAWAGTRTALDQVGGLIDHGILGSGDRHMACAMIGKVEYSYHNNVHPNYKELCLEWQRRCDKYVQRDVGYVPGLINHAYHGSKAQRGYNDRWRILVDNQFDPYRDVYRDTQGMWVLDDEKLELRDGIRRYFRSRQEDCTFTGSYKLLA